jgi:uncharacterized OsmC-like protein
MTTFVDAHGTPYGTAAAVIGEWTNSEVTVPVRCELLHATAVGIELGTRSLSADEPMILGGRGASPTPAQYLLAALGSSVAISFRYWSDRLGVRFDALRVELSGSIDLRGFIGLGTDLRPGFTDIRLTIDVSGSEPAARYEELRRAVDRHCPVLDALVNEVAVTTVLDVTAGR